MQAVGVRAAGQADLAAATPKTFKERQGSSELLDSGYSYKIKPQGEQMGCVSFAMGPATKYGLGAAFARRLQGARPAPGPRTSRLAERAYLFHAGKMGVSGTLGNSPASGEGGGGSTRCTPK